MKNFFIIASLLISSAHAAEAPSIVREIQNTFAKVQTIETNFTQTVSSARFGEKKSSGKLLIQRPGKMIWNYSDPKGKVFSANGDIITLYDPEDRQALVSPQPKGGKLPAGLSFLMGQSNLTDHFVVDVLSDGKNSAGEREVKLFCKPKSEMEFKELELTFVWKPNMTLVSSTTKDMLDSKNQIQFDKMKLNPSISSKAFDVKLPKDVPVVTGNSL
ncbi:MAG: outer membrane lipoprotein carrier protein LolA [Proteobacteria bacterium]|jgi:outer membrane lipoprotein carrier protein|nr:outer membrane lipoprotein carrier protein LolA [Pseudomonadota bacterium]